MFNRGAIYTYSDGRPIEGRPDPLPEGLPKLDSAEFYALDADGRRAVVQTYTDSDRAWAAYERRVGDVQLAAFGTAFREALNSD